MRVHLHSQSILAVETDLLGLPVWQGEAHTPETASLDKRLKGRLMQAWKKQKFSGKEGSTFLLPTMGLVPADHVLFVGMGEKKEASVNSWRRCVDTTIGQALRLKAKTAALALAAGGEKEEIIAAITEGSLLSTYHFDRYKSRTEETDQDRLKKFILLGADPTTRSRRRAQRRGELFAEATCYARDLINLPAAVVTPAYLGKEAERVGKEERLGVRVYYKKDLEKLGMGAILGVAQGSTAEPCFIEMIYRPRGQANKRVALVGKGVTFDSGGLSLKPPQGMEQMKRDMAGGATVLGVMKVIGRLAPPIEVRGYIPASENMPSGSAYKPGDILKTYSGKTVEVLNTDAEGRLLLADALSYACSPGGRHSGERPDVIIDIATLTGAVRTALGNRLGGILGTDKSLIYALTQAGKEVGEQLWELPLFAPYREQLDSPVADLKNIGNSGSGGTIQAALFLQEFVPESVPWAHLDVASVAFTDTPLPCTPRGAVGFGVRTFLRYLLDLEQESLQ